MLAAMVSDLANPALWTAGCEALDNLSGRANALCVALKTRGASAASVAPDPLDQCLHPARLDPRVVVEKRQHRRSGPVGGHVAGR